MAVRRRLAVSAWFAGDGLLRRVRPEPVRVALRAAHVGLWLGAAAPSLLAAIDEAAYRRRYAYHDTDEHNLRGLFDWETRALDAHFPRSGRLLVTSAGGGREVLALAARGHEVDAFECNAALRARADDLLARRGLEVRVRPAERDRCPVSGTYDGAVVGWGSYTFVRGTGRRRAFLRELTAALRPGAPVLLSFFTRARDSRRLALVRALGDAVGGPLGHEPVELGDLLDPTWQHYFTRDELADELSSAGLALARWSERPYAHAVAVFEDSSVCAGSKRLDVRTAVR